MGTESDLFMGKCPFVVSKTPLVEKNLRLQPTCLFLFPDDQSYPKVPIVKWIGDLLKTDETKCLSYRHKGVNLVVTFQWKTIHNSDAGIWRIHYPPGVIIFLPLVFLWALCVAAPTIRNLFVIECPNIICNFLLPCFGMEALLKWDKIQSIDFGELAFLIKKGRIKYMGPRRAMGKQLAPAATYPVT